MSENEIKPVAWRVTQGKTFVDRAFMDKGQADSSAESRRDGTVVVPLYDQSAIDRLTAERDAAVASRGRYFCDGPEGHFFCDDLELARGLVNAYDKDDDWTITDMMNPHGAGK